MEEVDTTLNILEISHSHLLKQVVSHQEMPKNRHEFIFGDLERWRSPKCDIQNVEN